MWELINIIPFNIKIQSVSNAYWQLGRLTQKNKDAIFVNIWLNAEAPKYYADLTHQFLESRGYPDSTWGFPRLYPPAPEAK